MFIKQWSLVGPQVQNINPPKNTHNKTCTSPSSSHCVIITQKTTSIWGASRVVRWPRRYMYSSEPQRAFDIILINVLACRVCTYTIYMYIKSLWFVLRTKKKLLCAALFDIICHLFKLMYGMCASVRDGYYFECSTHITIEIVYMLLLIMYSHQRCALVYACVFFFCVFRRFVPQRLLNSHQRRREHAFTFLMGR